MEHVLGWYEGDWYVESRTFEAAGAAVKHRVILIDIPTQLLIEAAGENEHPAGGSGREGRGVWTWCEQTCMRRGSGRRLMHVIMREWRQRDRHGGVGGGRCMCTCVSICVCVVPCIRDL